jgi:hypothetical protein
MEDFNVNKESKFSSDHEFQNSDLEKIKSNLLKEIRADFWLLEYQTVISQFTRYIGLYFLVFVVYLCIQGTLFLTIALSDIYIKNDEIRTTLIIFALVCCVLFFFCIIVATTIVQQLERRKAKALNKLGLVENEVDDEFGIGNATSLVYFMFNIGLIIIFILMLLRWHKFIY